MESPPADSFSTLERRLLPPGRNVLTALLFPVVWALGALHVSPHAVSFAQIPVAFLLFPFVASHPKIAFAIFVASVLLDAVDGALARRKGASSAFGAFFDQVCDHARETVVIAAFMWNGALTPLLALFYPFVYGLLNLVLYLCNRNNAPLPFVVKSYAVVYPAIFLFLWFDWNVFDAAVAASMFCMGVAIIAGMRRLHGAWKEY